MGSRFTLAAIDVFIISLSFAVSVWWTAAPGGLIWLYLILFILIKEALFTRFGLYSAILKFAGLPLATTIVKTTIFSSLICFFLMSFPEPKDFAIRFIVIDYLLTTFLVGISRFAPRLFQESVKIPGAKRVLIYGAGELGEEVARRLLKEPRDYKLVGFIDDNKAKTGKKIHNLTVHGTTGDLSRLLAKLRLSEIIIAISNISGETIRQIAGECRRHNVVCRIVPTFADILNQEINIKNIDITDLLRRKPQDLDEKQIEKFLKGKRILITGAAGSIGSELTRQCIYHHAGKLTLIDNSEVGIYSLQEEFSEDKIPIRFCLSDIREERTMDKIFLDERPEIVFHAAAYKHVPIVEENLFEGLKNNINGTITLSLLADKHHVSEFVLISTDKAVRPTSVMGASKRVCELYVQNFNTQSQTEFISVRFGNVLGSSGSVIPKFLDQINHGGPITVTHPEVTRYFMLTSEAVQLVLQAASIGNGGEIFILNMGSPVRILEMAEDLIFLAGKKPYKDVGIKFTGLRAGEKLYEELLIDESEKKTQYVNITIGRTTHIPFEKLKENINRLLSEANNQNRESVLAALKTIVPEFNHAVVEDLPVVKKSNVINLQR